MCGFLSGMQGFFWIAFMDEHVRGEQQPGAGDGAAHSLFDDAAPGR